MRLADKIQVAELRRLLDYDPETGVLTWRERTPDMFRGKTQPLEHTCKIWNAKYAGRPALNSRNGMGYLHGAVFGCDASAHRVAWAIHHGCWPKFGIDHINGNTADNRIENLRDVPDGENAKNQKQNRRNTSGVTGVHLHKKSGTWVASIKGNGKVRNLGYYATKEEAAAVRKAAERSFGFHENHGRKAA